MTTNRTSDWIAEARLRLARISETPGLEAQILVSNVTDRDRSWVIAHPEYYLSAKQLNYLKELLERRLNGEPLPYLIGHWEFFGLDFLVNPNVLIPRPETELLVEKALEWLKAHPKLNSVLDLGTGSGCIAISLAKSLPYLEITAADLSMDALEVSRQNAKRHKIDHQINFINSNLLDNVPGRFSLICANLPYIPSSKLDSLKDLKYEPRSALDGGINGMDYIKKAIMQSQQKTSSPGLILMEIESGQADEISCYVADLLPSNHFMILPDLSNQPRLLRLEC